MRIILTPVAPSVINVSYVIILGEKKKQEKKESGTPRTAERSWGDPA